MFRLNDSDGSPLLGCRPDGTPSILWSETGVRQCDPLGLLIFAAAFRDTREGAHASAPDAFVVGCHDDSYV